jgi:hypothetical protein
MWALFKYMKIHVVGCSARGYIVGLSPKNKCNNAHISILESEKKKSPTDYSAARDWKPPTRTRCGLFNLFFYISAYSPSESQSAVLTSALTTAMLKCCCES